MRAITKNEVVKILKGIRVELLNGYDISDVVIEGIPYLGDNTLGARELKFEGRVKSIIEDKIGAEVDKSLVYGGVQFVYDEEEAELFASVKVKVFTQWEVTEEWINIASIEIVK